jgi:sporulation protein YlmC with PRC-barrel domain
MTLVDSPLSAEELLQFPVRLDGIDVGRAVDLIVDPVQQRALGLDVLCGDDVHRFLPLAAAEVRESEIRVTSPFALVDKDGFEFYRGRASSLRQLKGRHVVRAGRDLGSIRDVVVSLTGEIEAFAVDTGQGRVTVPVDPRLSIPENGRNGSG